MNHLQEAFEKFDSNNPHVYELFKKYTLDTIKTGRTRYSAITIIHRIRWHTNIETNSDDSFKIANAHAAFYARKFMKDFPQYDNFFRTVDTPNHKEQ